MKSNNGLQIIIRITVCVTMLSSLIGAFMLHSTPSHRESGSVLILVSVAAAVQSHSQVCGKAFHDDLKDGERFSPEFSCSCYNNRQRKRDRVV